MPCDDCNDPNCQVRVRAKAEQLAQDEWRYLATKANKTAWQTALQSFWQATDACAVRAKSGSHRSNPELDWHDTRAELK